MKIYLPKQFSGQTNNIFGLLALTIFLFLTQFSESKSQFRKAANEDKFYFDALCFKDALSDSGRVDAFVLIPYQNLNFINKDNVYGAQYEIRVALRDSLGRVNITKSAIKTIREKDNFKVIGGTGAFDPNQITLIVAPGKYQIEVELTDLVSNTTSTRSRDIVVLDFEKFDYSTSGLLLLNSIEDRDGEFIITPHISDNIGMLEDGFFIFFEIYNKRNLEIVEFVYQIIDREDKIIFQSEPQELTLKNSTNTHYLKINLPAEASQGNYKLRLISKLPKFSIDSPSSIIAISERSIKNIKTISGFVFEDINLAINQLRYIANKDELELINSAEVEDEKSKRFESFWKIKDPTPRTERNEAFEQYYSRISIANKEFKSYNEGWLTDKGMVYVIFGAPDNVERSRPYSDNREYERWSYNRNNRQFVFVDNTGFGDYRLVQPIGITQKYEYQD